jgi:hypothetical protein
MEAGKMWKVRWTILPALLLLPLLSRGAETSARPPDLVLRQTIRYIQNHQILTIPFQVSAGTVRISMQFNWTGRESRTALDVGLLGPTGFRGWSGGDKNEFTLALADATPSYLPGPLSPGQWKLILGVPNIRPGVTSQFVARVWLDRTVESEARDPLTRFTVRSGNAWFRGDLHMHTGHSDGTCRSRLGHEVPCPLFRTVEDAEKRGLDFIAITDHNTQSHYDDERELQPYFDDILLMPGREITTYNGHANLLGTERFLDFRIGTPQVPTIDALLRQVQRLGAILSINHPSTPSGEQCMGCGWTPQSPVDYRLVQAVEVVNGSNADGPHSGMMFWESLLNQGYRLTAVGGSDNHHPDTPVPGPGSIGYPTTVVFAPALSTPAILDGIRAGHVFIDTEGTRDRLLEYSITAGGKIAAMGDSLDAGDNPLQIAVHVLGVRGAHLELTADGRNPAKYRDLTIDSNDFRTGIELSGETVHHWIRFDVCDSNGHRLLIGNPVYLRR